MAQQIYRGQPTQHGCLATTWVAQHHQALRAGESLADRHGSAQGPHLARSLGGAVTRIDAATDAAQLLQLGHQNVFTGLPLGGLKGKPQGHVETAQKQGLGGQLAVTLWQVVQVNDVPGSQCFLAVKIQGFSLSVCRINTGGFLVEAPQHRDLLAQILQAEFVPPVGEKRISKNSLFQRLKKVVAQKGELAGADACGLHGSLDLLQQPCLDSVTLLNAPRLQPFNEIALKVRIPQQKPQPHFCRRAPNPFVLRCELQAGPTHVVRERANGIKSCLRLLLLAQLRRQLMLLAGEDRVCPQA